MDGTTLIIIAAIAVPVLVVWALSKSAALRGPMPPARQGREPVEMLVTEAVHEEPAEDDAAGEPPRDPDAPPRRPEAGL